MSVESRQIARAVEAGQYDTAGNLCEAHAAKLQKSGELFELFKHAAMLNYPQAMQIYLKAGVSLDAPIDESTVLTVLYSASGNGATDSVKWLLSQDVTVNHTVEGELRCLPLFVAIREGHLDIVKALVEHGAVTETVWNGETPAQCAASHGHTAIAEYLRTLERG